MKRHFLLSLGAAVWSAVLCMAPAAHAQTYPSKPIQIVSSASPGTSGDAGLRMMTAKMSVAMGQPITVPANPQVIVSTYEIPVGAVLPFHKHPFPR